MAALSHFQLFPPPVPKITVNPPRSSPRNKTLASTDPSPVEGDVKSPDGESIFIQIVDHPDEGSMLENTHEPRSRSLSLEHEQETIAASPIDGHKMWPILIPPPPHLRQEVSADHNDAALREASPTSPFVPMKSMFPTYNPTIRLSQQQYFPQRVTSIQRQNVSREDYSPNVSSPSRMDSILGGPRTAPTSMVDFPMDVLTLKEPQFSSVPELERLWAATNGQEPETVQGDFDLRMSRTGDAVFTFGSTPSLPFYTLETYDTNELSISRTHPRRPTKNVPLLLLPLEPMARRLPPNDGLVTYIFPKLAAMLAIDQSTELAAQHRLAPSEREEMQSDAVERAAAQEACHLMWNERGRRYEFAHPAIGRDPNKSPHFAMSPTSPAPAGHPVLHITVSSDGLTSPMSTTPAPPVITVTNPNASRFGHSSSPAEIRMSTLPVSDTEEPLASLDFSTMTLRISAAQILEVAPSLYAVDSVVAAILAIAVADEATNPIMASMDIWSPRSRARASMFGGSVAGSVTGSVAGSIGGKSYTGSVLYATIAEREEAEEEVKMMRQIRDQEARGKSTKTSFWGRRAKKQKQQKKQILMGDFDLEKYGHFQAGSREGEELPGAVRGTLELLFTGLKFLVWMLTMLAQILAWLMVSVTRVVTSEKF